MPKIIKTKWSWIQKEFKARGYSQKEFAKAIGCSYVHLSQAINCKADFSFSQLQKTVTLLEVPQSDIGKLFDIGVADSMPVQPRKVLRFVAAVQFATR